jgi:hypothetical protein
LLIAAALGAFQRSFFDLTGVLSYANDVHPAPVIHKPVLNKTVNETVIYKKDNESAETIVNQAFNSSFGHHLVNKCEKSRKIESCCQDVNKGHGGFKP